MVSSEAMKLKYFIVAVVSGAITGALVVAAMVGVSP